MYDATDMMLLISTLLVLVFSGIHIAVALGLASMLGIYLLTQDFSTMLSFVSNTGYEALRDYIFAVIPLFMLMGEFLAKCGAASDLFTLINRTTRRIPGRLGVATVLANAVFAFVTGVSIAAAAAFSKIAYPEMRRYGYERQFSLGCIAGSACLGMLIPPSVLMIVWGVLTELAIGKLFIAGIIPGFIVVTLYIIYIIWVAKTQPHRVGEGNHLPPAQQAARDLQAQHVEQDLSTILWSTVGIICLVVLVLGGIGIGFGVGFYYKQIKTVEMPSKMVVVEKQDIILAVDENQRLMLIDKNTGNYTIYDNEIGKTIFTLYARNIWGQHNPNQAPPVK